MTSIAFDDDQVRALRRQYGLVGAADVVGRGANSVPGQHATALAFLQAALHVLSDEEIGGPSQRAAAEAEIARREDLLAHPDHANPVV